MAFEQINRGATANDGTGDNLREAFRKVNDNFDKALEESTTPSSVYGTDASGEQTMIPVSEFKDVLEFSDLASFPATGESGKIYVALDTNLQYRWSGSAYVQIGGGGKSKYVINFSFGSAWLGNINANWRTSLFETNTNIYTNYVGVAINFDGTTNTLVGAADNRITKWTLPFNCKLKDVQSYMAGALNVNLDFKILYWEAPTAFGQTNYTYLGRVFFTASGTGGKIFPTISELNTTTTLNKGGHIVIVWFNNTANPVFKTSLIQPIFEEV